MTKIKSNGRQFDSKLEKDVYDILKDHSDWEYHPIKIPYTITWKVPMLQTIITTNHTYEPDYMYYGDEYNIIYEIKSVFYNDADQMKHDKLYKLLTTQRHSYEMILKDENLLLKRRKGKTIGDWCKERNINYITLNQLRKKYK